jgi:hypothetical protein
MRERSETVGAVPGTVRPKAGGPLLLPEWLPTITNTALLKADCLGARNTLCYVAQDPLQSGF